MKQGLKLRNKNSKEQNKLREAWLISITEVNKTSQLHEVTASQMKLKHKVGK